MGRDGQRTKKNIYGGEAGGKKIDVWYVPAAGHGRRRRFFCCAHPRSTRMTLIDFTTVFGALYVSQGLWAVSSRDGKLIWALATDGLQLACLADSAFRSAQIVEDLNGDKVPDLLVAIKGTPGNSAAARK